MQFVNVLIRIVCCKVLPHDPFHGPVTSFSYTGFLFILCRIQCLPYSLPATRLTCLIVEIMVPLSVHSLLGTAILNSFVNAEATFQRYNPSVFAVGINHCQQKLVAFVRSGKTMTLSTRSENPNIINLFSKDMPFLKPSSHGFYAGRLQAGYSTHPYQACTFYPIMLLTTCLSTYSRLPFGMSVFNSANIFSDHTRYFHSGLSR